MHHFTYKNGVLHGEDVSISEIADTIGTPFYLYSEATLAAHFKAIDQSFADCSHLTCFAVKACSNIAILRLFARLGAGADIVSGGELFRALKAGIDPRRIIYSGVGKTADEMHYALTSGILMFNVESLQELERLQEVAAGLEMKAPVAFRINPDVDPMTHPYISTGLAENKFGIAMEQAVAAYKRAAALPNITVMGVSCHIGSQLTRVEPFLDALKRLRLFIDNLAKENIHLSHLDIGGGVGITYNAEEPPHPREYALAIRREMAGLDVTLILEPGRVIVGNAGILVTRVLYTKENRAKKFAICDAAMNDLFRPSLYQAYHHVLPVREKKDTATEAIDLVGPICETGDFLAKNREMPKVAPNDLLAVMSSGAYGFSMASNYNSRPRVPEILVTGNSYHVIRERETYSTLVQGEHIPDFLE